MLPLTVIGAFDKDGDGVLDTEEMQSILDADQHKKHGKAGKPVKQVSVMPIAI